MKLPLGIPLASDEYDIAMASLVSDGIANDIDILQVLFRGNYPNGVKNLHVDSPPTNYVNILPFSEDSERSVLRYPFYHAYIREDDPARNIYYNRTLASKISGVSSLAAGRLAMVRVHDLAAFIGPGLGIVVEGGILAGLVFSDNYRRLAFSSLMKAVTPSVAGIIGHEHYHLFQKERGMTGLQATCFHTFAQDALDKKPLSKQIWTMGKQMLDTLFTWMPPGALAMDNELESRLAVAIAQASNKWGCVPETPSELEAALLDLKIPAPKKIRDQYNSGATPLNALEVKRLKDTFNKCSWPDKYLSPLLAELAAGIDSFRDPETLEAYWDDFLRYTYGAILYSWGDSQGYERMGYSRELDITGRPQALSKSLALPPPSSDVA